jgi:hypothetical protein
VKKQDESRRINSYLVVRYCPREFLERLIRSIEIYIEVPSPKQTFSISQTRVRYITAVLTFISSVYTEFIDMEYEL